MTTRTRASRGLTPDQYILRLIAIRHGDRKQGWDARARARAIEALVAHHNLKGMTTTEAFIDFVIANIKLTPPASPPRKDPSQ